MIFWWAHLRSVDLPDINPFRFIQRWPNHLFKLVDNGLIIGGAILFLDKEKLKIGRIFISPENHRKGYGVFMMQEIEALYPMVKEFTLNTPIWNIRTKSFYKKLGYNEVRHDKEFVYYSKKR